MSIRYGDPVLEVERVKAIRDDSVLIEWEENTNYVAGGKLVRPETHKKAHYTGRVLMAGRGVDPALQLPDEDSGKLPRIVFYRFTDGEKYVSQDGKKRYVILPEEHAIAIIPDRHEKDVVGIGGELDWDN